jgi:hypothetical protein
MSRTSYSIYNTRSATDPGAPITKGVAASGTDTYYSDRWLGEEGFGLTVETTGTLTGTWTLWKTDIMRPTLANDDDWVDVSAHAEFVEVNPAGAATQWQVSSTLLRARFFRLKYVNGAGTGNLLADVTPIA